MTGKKTHFDVIVIGGGASGMMAAGAAASRGKSVLVLEKNPSLGMKLDITGGGRCNITNTSGTTTREFLANFGNAGKYLTSPFSQFGVKDAYAFFENHGLPLKTETGGRVFPLSEKAPDVTRTLAQYMRDGHASIRVNSPVTSLSSHGTYITKVTTPDTTYTAHSFVLATGGTSHPETGSTGDGFRWLANVGHTVVAPNPSLVPLKVSDAWVRELSGVTLEHMKIVFFTDGARAISKTGRLLFTHFGISGPLILNSAQTVGTLIKEGSRITATIDLFPDFEFNTLDQHILAIIDAHKNKLFRNTIDAIVPPGMSETVWKLFACKDSTIKAHSLTKEDRKRLVHLLKALPMHVSGLMGLDRAIVSDGGIVLDEIDTRTMRSRKIDNLFVTGDILNVNRPSGGYSLQLCWTTGYVAGMHA